MAAFRGDKFIKERPRCVGDLGPEFAVCVIGKRRTPEGSPILGSEEAEEFFIVKILQTSALEFAIAAGYWGNIYCIYAVCSIEIGVYGKVATARDAGHNLAFEIQFVDIACDVLSCETICLEGLGCEGLRPAHVDGLGYTDFFRDSAMPIDSILLVRVIGVNYHFNVTGL